MWFEWSNDDFFEWLSTWKEWNKHAEYLTEKIWSSFYLWLRKEKLSPKQIIRLSWDTIIDILYP